MGQSEEVWGFAFHVRGGDAAAIVADILERLGLRACDFNSSTGFFEREEAAASLGRWREYRDRAMS